MPRAHSANDERILALLDDHEVLTTSQLVRLTDLPERTVQHRLGRLVRAGLVNRVRPHREVGTSPYHCWLTSFGAESIGAGSPRLWSEDPTGVCSTASLTELWLQVRDRGPEVGLELLGWRRINLGDSHRDARNRSKVGLAAEAELSLAFGTETVTVLVLARTDLVRSARLVAVLARFVDHIADLPGDAQRPVLAVLVRTPRQQAFVLTAWDELVGDPRANPNSLKGAERQMAVGVVEPCPAGIVTDAVWRRPGDDRGRRLAEILTAAIGGGR